jgi:ribonuclease Y
MNLVIYLALAVAIGLILILAVMLLKNRQVLSSLKAAEQTAQKIIGDSKREAETIKKEAQLEAKDRSLSLRAEVEKQSKDRKVELHNLEKRLGQREELLEKKNKR